ncbi:MAG: DUF4129 domain-containing protein [Actinomycetia bacterium]|nr:DUF4129 domain-containing protein [Actinomycetes bacterium]MCH9700594.1 DUF4129 domain-containing protein [Actinomycetes bacterium]MCH9762602.1 DUF4129 domain-containing protein [Actinomycetes bacterium]
MPGGDKAVARTVAVIALLLLAVVALRGHFPGAEPPPAPREPESADPGSIVPTVVMLSVSILVIAIAIVFQTRRRRTPGPGELPYDDGVGRIKVPWRLVLIAAGVLLAWMLAVLLLMRWGSGLDVDPASVTDPEATDPPDGAYAEPAPPPAPAENRDVFGILGAVTIMLFLLSIAGAMIGRRRAEAAAPVSFGVGAPAVDASEDVPGLARATELGLAEIGDPSRDPREAIIACYAAMERELGKSPGTTPQDSDTPAEVLARAVELRALRADSAAELVELFEEARFSSHVMNEDHRADAVRALRVVQRELQGAR